MASYPALWFTSRTPTDIGQRRCRMERYQAFHAGPHGTGYQRKSLSVPLATGTSVHIGAELMAEWILEYQEKHHGLPPQLLPVEVIAWAASEAAARYEVKARAKGFAETSLEAVGSDLPVGQLPPQIETLILEQRTLIEAQVWIFGTLYLPGMLGRYRLIGSEHEESLVLDCTCGLGDGFGDWRAHAPRGCAGIVQMGRADYLWEGYTGEVAGTVVYDEFKTKATPNAPWEKAWEHSGQLLVNMETAARRLGKKIDHASIVVLFKGWRGRDRGAPETEAKYQHTPLIYGYHDPGADGIRPAAWAAKFKWHDDYGKGHTLPRTYHRHPIWDESVAMPPMGGQRPDATRVERWILGYIEESQWPDFLKVLGPFPHPVYRVPLAMQSILAEERDWRGLVEDVRAQVAAGVPEWQVVDALIPRSWACTSYDGTPCAFKWYCDRNPGWEDLLGSGRYDIRRPHHATEREACEALGIQFPPDADDLEEETDAA
jgi:hypothetical protein